MSFSAREILINGNSIDPSEIEAKLDEGNILEAESSLRETLSLSSEEARAVLAKLEYRRGNMEAVLRVLDGIDLKGSIQSFQPSIPDNAQARRRPASTESIQSVSQPQQSQSLVFEGMYLKSKSLQSLDRLQEAVQECESILDIVEKIFCNGIPDAMLENKLQETITNAVELLPELCEQAGCEHEAVTAYRRALLNQWSLDNEWCARIQKRFAVFLLYGGVQADAYTPANPVEGSFVPKNNLEEAILILMILLRKCCLKKTKWDPVIMEHFTFALSFCDQTLCLSRKLEELLPGMYPRCERWNHLALCYSGAGQNEDALNLLRKSLNKHENPTNLIALLLAAKICSKDHLLASEGATYAQKAIANAQGENEHLKSVGLHMLGICLRKQAQFASSDMERSALQSEALKSLNGTLASKHQSSDSIFELGVEYAEQRNSMAALHCAKEFINRTGGWILKGWKLLALVLSAQQRFSESEVVIDAALDETVKWEQGPLLRMKAKLKIAQSLPMDAVEIYRFLLALAQAQKDTFGSFRRIPQMEDDNNGEFEAWQGLACLYCSLSHWKDAELCLEKARSVKQFSAATLHIEGTMHEAQGQILEALATYMEAYWLDRYHVPSKLSIGSLMWKIGSKSLPVARSFLSDALRHEPTNRMAWYYLGMVYRDNGRIAEATDCFLAASMLEESDPIESFSSAL